MVPLGHVEKRETKFQLQKCQSAAVWLASGLEGEKCGAHKNQHSGGLPSFSEATETLLSMWLR